MRLPRRRPKPTEPEPTPPTPAPDPVPVSRCGRCDAELPHVGAVCDCRKA